jgi:hypothetical protein
MTDHLLRTGDGRTFMVEVPDQAYDAAEEWARQDLGIALAQAAPYIIAAELRSLVNEMRSRPANQAVAADDIVGRINQLVGEGWIE